MSSTGRICDYPGCGEATPWTDWTRCEEHNGVPLPTCSGCVAHPPATRRCAFDVADVCDDCGERSDRRHAEMVHRDKRLAAMELV